MADLRTSELGTGGESPANKAALADHLRTTAERCEQATEPSKHLDAQIFILLDPDAQHIVGQKPGRFPQEPIYGPRSSFWDWAVDESLEPPVLPCPAYTSSLDAAMSLVPEGFGFLLDRYWLREGERWSCKLTWGILGDTALVEDCHWAPLAICAAALKARVISA